MDKYKINSQKLSLHPDRVAAWEKGEQIYPLYVEISPSGACNHRCIFCALDFMEYKSCFLETEKLKETIADMVKLGVKSIMFGGEGEPLLHKDLPEIIFHAKHCGIDVALTTNGVMLEPEIIGKLLFNLSWVKFSIDAGTPNTYAKIHRTKEEDFYKVMNNLFRMVILRNKLGVNCTIGAQAIILQENVEELEILIREVKKLGVDYIVLKRYSQHNLSKNKICSPCGMTLGDFVYWYSNEKFSVILRDKMESYNYSKCRALPFWSYISSIGDVWACSSFIGDPKFFLGNIYKNDLRHIWDDKIMEVNVDKCRLNCRMNKCNEYLQELLTSSHKNFI